jgi:sulfur carrier protein ThiS
VVKIDGKFLPWREGMTVADLLRDLGDHYPYTVVRISGRLVTRPQFEEVAVADGSEVYPIPLIAGG